MGYQDFIVSTIYRIIDFCKSNYAWGNLTIWQILTGLFVVNGIVSAFQFGREFYEIRKRNDE